MTPFLYDSTGFQAELAESPHHAGEVAFLQSISTPGALAVEVGTNRGVTAIAIGRAIGRQGHLDAFEPIPEYYTELEQNLAANRGDNITAHKLALSDRAGRVRFYKDGGGSGITPADGARALSVQATTLTEFLAGRSPGRIDLLHMDCEGSELLVLQGARAVLEEQAPRIFCEIHRPKLARLGQSAGQVARFLVELGYDVRPVQVEDLDAEVDLEQCSHIFARRRIDDARVEELKEQIADLKARIPAHSVRPGMIQELEDLEEQLKAAQEGRRV
ncbi:MAG: FkbM family methyltransferase [Planctomycetota bacterium]